METKFFNLLFEFNSIPKPKRRRTFLEISGYPHYENVCSNILKFYLEPNNEHGLKDLVINSIVKQVNKDFQLDSSHEGIEVHREYQTSQGKRIDLLVTTNKWVIGIENKIFHHLHNDLEDYRKTIDSLCVNSRTAIRIVLSLNKLSIEDLEKVESKEFESITYEQVFENIKDKIGNYLINANSHYVSHLTDFITSLENLKPKNMENKKLGTFFNTHSDTIEKLIEEYGRYRKDVLGKVKDLDNLLSEEEFAPLAKVKDYYEKPDFAVFFYSYEIGSKCSLGIDTVINIKGWSIEIFSRGDQSSVLDLRKMLKEQSIIPNELDSYKIKGSRIIYHEFETDSDIEVVKDKLVELVKKIEAYKAQIEK